MKSILAFVIFLSFTATSFAQRVQSSCDAPDSIKKMYREDAAWLAYKYEQKINSPYLDSVIIPQDFQDRFMNALLAVYNVKGLPQADTVTKYKFNRDDGEKPYTLHTFRDYPLNKILLYADTSIQWQNSFIKGIKPSGNFGLDILIEKNNIVFDTLYYSIYGCAAFTKDRYNMTVLDSLMNVAGLSASVDGICCGGDGLEGQIFKDSSIQLIYSLGWGDCLVGCGLRRYWHFTVYHDCSVQFDSSYGDPWPHYANVQNQPDNLNLVIYPNPTSGVLTIESQPQTTIEVLDILGKTLQKTIINEGKRELDISSFLKGNYYIRAVSKSGKISTAKFIKQ